MSELESDFLSEKEEKREEEAKLAEQYFRSFFDFTLDNYIVGRRRILQKKSPTTSEYLFSELENLWMANIKSAIYHNKHFEFLLPIKSYYSLADEREEAKDDLIQSGRDHKTFWFKKNHFKELIKVFNKQDEKEATRIIGYLAHGGIGLKNEIDQGREKKVKKMIKEADRNFVADLKKVKKELKSPLRVISYWLKVASLYFLPWVIATLQLWLVFGCKDGT